MNRGRPEAAAAIWNWKDDQRSKRERIASLRRGAILRAIIGAIAGGIFFSFDRPTVAYVVFSIASFTLLLALVSPLGAYTFLERAIAKVGNVIGRILTILLLAPVFYLFFAPFGLLFRRGARDPMKRRYEPDQPTYWKKRDEDRPNLDRPY